MKRRIQPRIWTECEVHSSFAFVAYVPHSIRTVMVLIALVTNSALANHATASIDVTSLNFLRVRASGNTSEGQAVGDEKFFDTIPFSAQENFNAAAGGSYSNNTFNLFTSGEQSVLSFDSEHLRSPFPPNQSSAELQVDMLQFTADANAPFTLSGFYQGLAGQSSAGEATYQVHLIEEGVGTLFRHTQQSVNERANFTLGVPAGHPIFIDSIIGSPTGNLVAGHTYTLYYGASTVRYNFDHGSTTFGNLTLTVGPPQDYLLTVEYQTPEVTGPLIPGFDPIPETITAKFLLDDVVLGGSPIGLDQVLSFELNAPGLSPTVADLDHFQLALDGSGTPTSLNWGVQGFDNGTFAPVDILNNNFNLTISGTDLQTEEDFSYFWGESINSFEPVAQTPGDFDNDGDVDGRDFLTWQRGESPDPMSTDDLSDWQLNYGDSEFSAMSVPEPYCLCIAMFAGMALCGSRYCK